MFGSTVLEVGIGLVFVYWLLGLLCSTINEQVIVPILKLRAKFLEEGITNMLTALQEGEPARVSPQEGKPTQSSLSGSNLVNALYNTPLIKGLSRKYNKPLTQKLPLVKNLFQKTASDTTSKPSYIPGDTFALALMSLNAVQDYTNTPSAENSLLIPAALKTLIEKANKDSAQELANIEKWYNDAMDRVTGWYKRRVQFIIFILGLVIVVALNIDTISLITNLSNNTAQRSAIVSAAQGATNAQNNSTNVQNNSQTIQNNIKSLQPFIGWSSAAGSNSTLPVPADFWGWVYWVLYKIVGLLATILAVSLGAPFWFDLLNKFMAFRSSGPPPQPRTGPSESTGTPQQLAITVAGAQPTNS